MYNAFKVNSRNGALPGPFSSPFGFEEVLELETSIFKLQKTIIAHFEDLDKPIKMTSLNLKNYLLFWNHTDKQMDKHFLIGTVAFRSNCKVALLWRKTAFFKCPWMRTKSCHALKEVWELEISFFKLRKQLLLLMQGFFWRSVHYWKLSTIEGFSFKVFFERP